MMHSRKRLCVAIGLGLAGLAGLTRTAGAVEPEPFPNGYGYMDQKEIAVLTEALARRTRGPLREHGWKLWAGIMQPNKAGTGPIWYTWWNTYFAFLSSSTGATVTTNVIPTKSRIELMLQNAPPGSGNDQYPPINLSNLPFYPIPSPVREAYKNATTACSTPANPENICDGSHFLFNGDIMIPTETLSTDSYDYIHDGTKLVLPRQALSLTRYWEMQLKLQGPDKSYLLPDVPQASLITKHMYWPVKANAITGLPVWDGKIEPASAAYDGYEVWQNYVAIDTTSKQIGKVVPFSIYYGISYPVSPTKKDLGPLDLKAKAYRIEDFYYHKVTEQDWKSYDENDKAILNAASYWAYGQPFGIDDYLVTIAMHINTKEVPSWGLQSVWWSDQPDSGPFADNRPTMPSNTQGPWNHYLMADAYGIPDSKQPVAMNPYIEMVIHPQGTNCQNCHIRAGWPNKLIPGLKNAAGYTNEACPDPLATLNYSNGCFNGVLMSDFMWIIPDRAVGEP